MVLVGNDDVFHLEPGEQLGNSGRCILQYFYGYDHDQYMRYRKPTTMQAALGQYFTPEPIAALLAARIPRTVSSVLELGAGDGALAMAVRARLPHVHMTLVEIDGGLRRKLRCRLKNATLVAADVMDVDQIGERLAAVTYAATIGNPPFTFRAIPERTDELVGRYGLLCSSGGHWHRSDLVFVHESIERLQPGGTMAMILSSPLLTQTLGTGFRRRLLSEFSNVVVTELPRWLFGIEVQTFMVSGRRKAPERSASVVLNRVDSSGAPVGQIEISRGKALQRMDYGFHQASVELGTGSNHSKRLSDIDAVIIRGSRSHVQLSAAGMQHLHTSDFDIESTRFRLPKLSCGDLRMAEAGDIVIPRVGSRCLLRQGIVDSGSMPYSESVYRLRVPRRWRRAVFETLSGEVGIRWRQLNAHGACAKHLTITDLLAMPLAA